MGDWWEGNVHYTVYVPDTLGPQRDMVDTFRVAEAAIYSSDGTPKIGLYFLVTKQDLLSGVTKERAIGEADRVMRSIAEEWKARVEEEEGSIQIFYSWSGEEIKRRQVGS
ncbi:MAG: hypothetical protein ACRDFW_04610 [bacterium]